MLRVLGVASPASSLSLEESGQLSSRRALARMGSLCSCISVGKLALPARGVNRQGHGFAMPALKVSESKDFGSGKMQRFSVLTGTPRGTLLGFRKF